jgi:hypothetical protein
MPNTRDVILLTFMASNSALLATRDRVAKDRLTLHTNLQQTCLALGAGDIRYSLQPEGGNNSNRLLVSS